MQDKIYPKGIRVFSPRQNAPSFVKGSIVITTEELSQFIKENSEHLTDYQGKKQLKLNILENSKGLYVTVDTWKGNNEQKGQSNDLPF